MHKPRRRNQPPKERRISGTRICSRGGTSDRPPTQTDSPCASASMLPDRDQSAIVGSKYPNRTPFGLNTHLLND